jgi:hypothetical protein
MEPVPAASFAAGAEQTPKDWFVANAFRREVASEQRRVLPGAVSAYVHLKYRF